MSEINLALFKLLGFYFLNHSDIFSRRSFLTVNYCFNNLSFYFLFLLEIHLYFYITSPTNKTPAMKGGRFHDFPIHLSSAAVFVIYPCFSYYVLETKLLMFFFFFYFNCKCRFITSLFNFSEIIQNLRILFSYLFYLIIIILYVKRTQVVQEIILKKIKKRGYLFKFAILLCKSYRAQYQIP